MNKRIKLLVFSVILLFAFSINLVNVEAYFTSTSEEKVNTFTLAQPYTNTYIYNLENFNGTVTKLGEKTEYAYAGSVNTLGLPNVNVSNYDFQNITINGTGNYEIGDSFTQPANDLTIVYTYKPHPRTFTVTHNQGNSYNFNGPSTALEGSTYTATASPQGNNRIITDITITMGGRTLSSPADYTYEVNGRNYSLTIPNVSGDININVTTQNSGGGDFPCLAEGTEVMLWNGTTKKIEDVTYTDLLKIWNHDKGTYGYEYAGWLEKEGIATEYTKVTFSDGNTLNVIGNHSIFSKTKNKYVDINSDEFNVGDQVINLQSGINYVTVTSIEHIEGEIKYYHVISSRYFNLITNNILTTYEIYNNVSNFMGFDDNLKWQKVDEVRSDMYTYDDFLYIDKYLFKVFRLEETKYLIQTGLVTALEFDDLYTNYLMDNDKKVIPPTNADGKYLWMVTTSDDANPNDTSHQLVEGSSYTVPTPNNVENFKYWYNHSDNKTYQPGDVIEVDSSMYLEAIYN